MSKASMQILSFVLFFGTSFLLWANSVQAWENHALGTQVSLEIMSEVNAAAPVEAAPLESFLMANPKRLCQVLEKEEAWARQTLPTYPPRPEALRFEGTQGLTEVRRRFLRAIRVNPNFLLALYLQYLPGESSSASSKLDSKAVSLLSLKPAENRFISLEKGKKISALSVVTSATDEPDYGLDIGVWEDNRTDFGPSYRFGKQPFGNPVLEFSSQAPFHMGFYHEPALAYWIAGYLSRTYPEYRIHLYLSLSRFAFQQGHPYWGWRFAGWGLHYIQDLTQPYHTTVMPGVSFAKMVFLGVLDILGFHSPVVRQVQLLTNEHLALENYQYHLLSRLLERKETTHPVLQALRNGEIDSRYPLFGDRYPRDVISLESHSEAKAVHKDLGKCLPMLWVTDSSYLFETTDPTVDALKEVESSASSGQMQTRLGDLLGHFGAHSRNYIRAVLAPEIR